MSSKLALSLAAALALSVASGIARADSSAPSSDENSKASKPPTNDQLDAAETGLPADVDYPNRATSKQAPTKADLEAAEAGNPHSSVNKDRPRVSSHGKSNSAWRKSESANPHSTEHE